MTHTKSEVAISSLPTGSPDPFDLGFPRNLLPLLRCIRDSGELRLCRETRSGRVGVIEGTLRCIKCSAEYAIQNGVARLMAETLTEETAHEIELKDSEYEALPDDFEAPSSGWRSQYADGIEIPPHLEELAPLDGCKVLELGCGDGRFTMLMAQLGAEILAVDVSFEAVRKLARRLPSGIAPTTYRINSQNVGQDLSGRVGLVQADASNFRAASRSFDRALSATPLDSRDERMSMYRAVAEALTDEGRYVAGVEHDDLSRRLLGMPSVKRYTPGGIFVEHLTGQQLKNETAPYFSRLRVRFIRVHAPLLKHLPAGFAVRVALTLARIPLLRLLGELVLVSAERPVRPPVEGLRRAGSAAAKGLYRCYKRLKRQEPIWDPGEKV